MKQGKTGFARIIAAAGYSIKGFKAAWKHEAAFRQEILICIILLPLSFYIGKDFTQVSILIGTLALLLIAELANSAIEAVVDRFGGEIHELSGRAKDIGSAMVMLALIFLLLIWGLIAYQNFYL